MLFDQVPDVLVVTQAQTEDIDPDRQGLEAVVAEVLHSRYSALTLRPFTTPCISSRGKSVLLIPIVGSAWHIRVMANEQRARKTLRPA
jgi:hypothetical protein